MRWERLFGDLESQTEAELRQQEASEHAERARYEFGLLTLRDRLAHGLGAVLELRMLGGHELHGRLRAVGLDWLVLDESNGAETIVNLGRLLSLEGGLPAVLPHDEDDSEVPALALRHLLRGLGRDRAGVTVLLGDGSRMTGTIDRVARDHVELAVHPLDVARRARSITQRRTLVTGAVAAVRVSD